MHLRCLCLCISSTFLDTVIVVLNTAADLFEVFTGGVVYMSWYKENVLWKVCIEIIFCMAGLPSYVLRIDRESLRGRI